MKLHKGVWFPDHEEHMLEWCDKNGEIVDGKTTYQIKKLRAALAQVSSWRTAVDVGGHVGLWSMHLVKRFASLHVFEPVAEHRDCFMRNVGYWDENGCPTEKSASAAHVVMHGCALGENEGRIRIETPHSSSGGSHIAGEGDIPLCTLDSFNLVNVDFIKLDCEGYELFALKGGSATIARDLPAIIVEQKPGRAQRFGLPEVGAVEWLMSSFGYECVAKMSGDFIMVPGR